jgi:hypothetical protein
MSEFKAVSYEFEGTKMVVKVDPNKDGEAVLKIEIDLKEVPDEVLVAITKKEK